MRTCLRPSEEKPSFLEHPENRMSERNSPMIERGKTRVERVKTNYLTNFFYLAALIIEAFDFRMLDKVPMLSILLIDHRHTMIIMV